jgi:hypothetical protein
MNPSFDFWERLKAYAAEYARSPRPLPVDKECERELRRMTREHFSGQKLPHDALRFYATELCSMIERYRSSGRAITGTVETTGVEREPISVKADRSE